MRHSYILKKTEINLDVLILLITILLFTAGCDQQDIAPVLKNKTAVIKSDIPDFSVIKDINEKKRSFFSYIRPSIESENAIVLSKREKFLGLYEKHENGSVISSEELKWLDELRAEYRIKKNPGDPEQLWTDMLKRVDMMPLDLAMIQAAMESGWGSSRFARAGNNMFGQWCFKEGCGIVPDNREDGAKHEVRIFKSVNASVKSYIHNLNTHIAYEGFRQLRLEQRQLGMKPNGYGLVSEMPKYSQRGEAYIEEIRGMILVNMPFMGS